MVAHAIQKDLLARIQNFVANDVNRRQRRSEPSLVRLDDVYLLSFVRIFNTWQAYATVENVEAGIYQISYDNDVDKTICLLYHKGEMFEAIL